MASTVRRGETAPAWVLDVMMDEPPDRAVLVGVAGWSIPTALADRFSAEGSHLARYATHFRAVEVNSSFYRPHRRATYARWAASVPEDFRFAVKLPKSITHDRRLVDCADLLARFADEVDGLGDKRGPVLVQLPPTFAFDATLVERFFRAFTKTVGGAVACEPRHASWFTDGAESLLRRDRIARVAADPAPVPAAARPGGWEGLAYIRLHGSPNMYWSAYGEEAVAGHARTVLDLVGRGAEVWVIYDNTAAGAAVEDAATLVDRVIRG